MPTNAVPTGGTPVGVEGRGRPPSRRPAWLVVTTLGVVVVTVLGAMTTARVGAVALAALVAGCAVVRAVSEPAALSVRSRRTDVLVLSLLALALGAVATRLPAS